MQQSRAEVYLHFVWATYRRLPLLTPGVEQAVYRCILRQVRDAGCEVLAIGGMPDHVHLAVRMATTAAPADLAQRAKGVSSTVARRMLGGDTFGWQDGYGVFSFSRSHARRVVAYVRNQRRHHGAADLWPEWEPTTPHSR